MEQMQIEERLESFKKQEQEFKDKVDVLQKEVWFYLPISESAQGFSFMVVINKKLSSYWHTN